jgi:hypothetical protein
MGDGHVRQCGTLPMGPGDHSVAWQCWRLPLSLKVVG